MSEGFKPGVDAARKALGAAIPIVSNIHPGGAKGVRLSLQEVANRIKKGRNDPRVRAWAVRAIKSAGGPQDSRSQAQAILSALKQATVYVQDPVNTEFIQAAHETLCLDDKGLCFRGGDCDDLVVAYGSATLSVGIPTKIIGEAFDFKPVASHVLAAIQDTKTGEWLRVDPSTNKPVGEYIAGTSEEWIDPMMDGKTGVSGDASGDFVGVGNITPLWIDTALKRQNERRPDLRPYGGTMKRGIAAPGFATIVVTDGNVNATTTVTAGQNLLLETPTSDGVFTAVTSVVDPAQFQGVLIAPSTLTGNQAALQATQPGSALVNFSWTDSGGTHQGSVPVNIIAATPSTTSSSVAPWIVAAIAGAAVGALAWHATHPSRVPLSVTATGRARKR